MKVLKLLKMNIFLSLIPVILLATFSCANDKNLSTTEVRGWNILSDHEENALMVIDRAVDYNINHLQLSHHIVHDLRHVKSPPKAELVNKLTKEAHEKGIDNVLVWDHALYNLSYYPEEFIMPDNGLINLDNPEFWTWLKDDYRDMLQLVPDIDGIILTFIETGAHAEDQYSEVWKTEEEKLANLVDSVASVVIDEFDMQLYIRTFVYTRAELSSMLKSINLIQHPDIRVMTKETPHDFFLTHPVSTFVEDIRFPVIIEFDAAHEYNGQNIVNTILPQVHMERWKYYQTLDNVIGYVARTDRFGTTTIINTPAEINLYGIENVDVSMDTLYGRFISENYHPKAIPALSKAFALTEEITTSIFYTLGLNTNSHSRLDYNDDSGYQRHVSAKWMDEPITHIGHGIDKDFHYWKDIVNHLSPAYYKGENGHQLSTESRWVLDSNWLEPVELMDTTYLNYILTEKEYGVQKAEEALALVKEVRPFIADNEAYDRLESHFTRTLITAKLYEGGAKVYFGYRVYARGGEFQTDKVKQIFEEGIADIKELAQEIINFPDKGPEGQYEWEEDAYRALFYSNQVEHRETNDFYQGFFPRINYSGMNEEQRNEVIKKSGINLN